MISASTPVIASETIALATNLDDDAVGVNKLNATDLTERSPFSVSRTE